MNPTTTMLQTSASQLSSARPAAFFGSRRHPKVACQSYQNRGPFTGGQGSSGFGGMGVNPWSIANNIANKTLAQLLQEFEQEVARASAQGRATYPGTPGYQNPIPQTPQPQQAPPGSDVQLGVDIVETEDSIAIFADVPGLAKSDLKIRINPKDRVLSISGDRPQPSVATPSDSSMVQRWERRFGSFKREVPLPDTVDTQAISAKVDRGVLRIKILKLIKGTSSDQEIIID